MARAATTNPKSGDAQFVTHPGIGTTRGEEARAASARWPAQPHVTRQIETMTRQMHIREVPMNTEDELERVFPSGEEDAGMSVFPSGEEDAGMRVFPSGEEDAGSSSRQPPAAGLSPDSRTLISSLLPLVLLVVREGDRFQSVRLRWD